MRLTEEALTQAMADYIRQAPRMWRDILKHFHGQPYPLIYRAFGNLRPKLGRVADRRPDYPYNLCQRLFRLRKGQGREIAPARPGANVAATSSRAALLAACHGGRAARRHDSKASRCIPRQSPSLVHPARAP
ncbi:hypothetical protein [Solidesulfovibrio carbinolicus]|uniref:Uncharacterized protein n=1 Tax=Solidesulfovibrio carbinolicus TaxID=296842 RepID=A0A4P6HZ57_9BACT|nr:hypothetical protein [Solidesulfovibrio carbinolicus]QAZ66659.1 hypothetical protein C3Y92_05135 [Solidesulfovibrio carbinolicus]